MGHVGQHAEAADAVVTIEQLDQRVGVRDRCRLVGDHQQHLLRAHEADYRVADTGRGVDDQHIDLVAHLAECLDQPCVLQGRQLHHALGTGRCRHDANATRPLDEHVTQIALAGDYVGQGALAGQTQQHVDVGQAEVGVEQHHAPTEIGQGQRQIDRHVGLADATLAAGHRNHLYGMHTHVHTPISCWGLAHAGHASDSFWYRCRHIIQPAVTNRCTTRRTYRPWFPRSVPRRIANSPHGSPADGYAADAGRPECAGRPRGRLSASAG